MQQDKMNKLRDLKILVVEDSALSFALTKVLIEHLTGRSPERARDGQEAIERLCASASFDLVIMDQMMPRMSGVEATRSIRALLPAWKQPRIVGLSGAATHRDLADYREAGMDCFLAKPVRLAQLKGVLEVCVEERPFVWMVGDAFASAGVSAA